MVFYFSATGNSLYVARQMEGSPISIPQAIHSDCQEYTAESIGIVAPVYGHELPPMVKDFIRQATFKTDYFYMILTYGNRHGGAAELAKNFCAECGIRVNYINVIIMVDNWLPSFDMDEQKKLDKHVDENLKKILEDLSAHKNMISEVTDIDRAAHQEFLGRMRQMPEDIWQHLILVKDNCIGCGICEKVCPSASIRVENEKAVHISGKCQTCFACVHACPKKAIGLTIPEVNPNARYRNEHISLQDVIEANCQKNK